MSSSAPYPRVPKTVDPVYKYVFSYKGAKKEDKDESWNETKQIQVEAGRIAAYYLGEFEKALEEYKNAKQTKSSNRNTQYPYVEKVLNMYMIYKIAKDIFETEPQEIASSDVEIQIPGRLFGYSIRENGLKVNLDDISALNDILKSKISWIKDNLVKQYPIRPSKNSIELPSVENPANVITRGAGKNENSPEFANSVSRHYAILLKHIQGPGIKNMFTIQTAKQDPIAQTNSSSSVAVSVLSADPTRTKLQQLEDWLTNRVAYSASESEQLAPNKLLEVYTQVKSSGITNPTLQKEYPTFYSKIVPLLAGQSAENTNSSSESNTANSLSSGSNSNSNTNSSNSNKTSLVRTSVRGGPKKGGKRAMSKKRIGSRKKYSTSKSKKSRRS